MCILGSDLQPDRHRMYVLVDTLEAEPRVTQPCLGEKLRMPDE
jgi:hypothetical protein